MHNKVGIIGRFGFGKELLNGQTIKAKSVENALSAALGADNILCIDTYGGINMMLRLPFQCIHAMHSCKNLVILPAHKGIRIIAPMLIILNKFYKRKLHYVVIGAWISELLKGKRFLARCLKQFDFIYVETSSMKRNLEAQGFHNVVLMPNFKALNVLDEDTVREQQDQCCRLCTFSRVMQEKGIDTAINAVKSVNAQINRDFYRLDIYGQIKTAQKEWFEELRKSFGECIRYCGEVPFDQSVSVLCKYDALLFPTKYFTEGIPGTIIDAYAAGIPVIASKWENYDDILDEKTGIGYPFDDPNGLRRILLELVDDSSKLTAMRAECIRKAKFFLPESVIHILLSRLG